jgi:hypothetical protein
MVVARVVFLLTLLLGLNGWAFAENPAGQTSGERLALATILATPDQHEGKEVLIRGVVVERTRATFPNGRVYYTLSVSDGATATVFSWERPPVEPGESVEVVGVFHAWRYNLRNVIESRRIKGSGTPTKRRW